MKWLCISTSSPVASVALFEDAKPLGTAGMEAPMRASGAVFELLDALLTMHKVKLADFEILASDVGPGSFTGVKVGVTIAKTLGYALGKHVAGMSAFDLIEPNAACAIPSRKRAYLLREPGSPPIEIAEGDARLDVAVGYGEAFVRQVFPSAGRAGGLLGQMRAVSAFELSPNYVLEPNISAPKQPYRVPE